MPSYMLQEPYFKTSLQNTFLFNNLHTISLSTKWQKHVKFISIKNKLCYLYLSLKDI